MTTPSAALQVFATPELSDYIFSFILSGLHDLTNLEDPRSVKTHANANLLTSVLHLSEVCRTLQRAILGSKYIQRALYLLSDPVTSRSWSVSSNNQTDPGTYRPPTRTAPSLNPIIQTTFPSYHLRLSYLGTQPQHQAILIVTRRDMPAVQRKGASGQGKTLSSMLLTQPPCNVIEATIYEERDETKEYVTRTTSLADPRIECETGITLGLVHARVGEMFEKHEDVVAIRLATV
ncbi:hypothetical protein PRZ48_002002 [Zasmidium cellare]|uniref:Uncharacterized protein n=1 Tax=Zasmidium cellare TaxID=395010 RepID=A0ABR0F2T9_ZASCE|nr:hypothetical protein PRZ48_002002 [Zasmidium cellare]